MIFDENFTEESFKAKVNNIFILLYSSVMNKDLKRIDHFVNDEVYENFNNIIKELEAREEVQMYEQLNVKSTEIISMESLEDRYVAKVKIVSRALDYVMDKSGHILRGNDSTRVEKENYLTLEKAKQNKQQAIARKCPHCGANMDVNYSGVCAYCGGIYNNEDYDWILTEIKTN